MTSPREQIIEVMARAMYDDDCTKHAIRAFDEITDGLRAAWCDRSQAALTALEQSGYIVRPREATEGMLDEGKAEFLMQQQYPATDVNAIYTAMTAAWDREQMEERNGE